MTRLLGATLGLTFALALAMSQPANADGIDRTYQVGEGPGAIAIDPGDGRLYIANRASSPGFISVIDRASDQVTSVATSGTPRSLALDAIHRHLYVSNANRTLDVFDLPTMSIIATLPVYGVGIAVDASSQRVYVAGETEFTVIDGVTNAIVATRPAVEGEDWFSVALDPSLHRVYVTNYSSRPEGVPPLYPSLVVLDDRDLSIVTELRLPVRPLSALGVDDTRHRVYVAGAAWSASTGYVRKLLAFDGVSLVQIGSVDLSADPIGLAVGTDRIYVTSLAPGYYVVDSATFQVLQTFLTLPLRPFLPALDAQAQLYFGAQVFGAPYVVVAISAGNHAPVVTSASFNPSAPTTNDRLSFVVAAIDGDFADVPGGQRDPVTLSYDWSRNGSLIPGETTSTLDLSRAGVGDRGDTITARVTVADPEGLTTTASASVVIANTPPDVTVTLSSWTPGTNAVLTASASTSDADGDPVSLAYEWLQNGAVIPGATTAALDLAAHGDQGDSITVRVTATDDHAGAGVATATALVVPSSGSYLALNSQAGDYIGGGSRSLYTSRDSTVWGLLAQGGSYFDGRFIQGVYVHNWVVEIGSPTGQALSVGSYPGARRFPTTTSPGLDVSGDGRGCNTVSGRFDVTELSFSASGVLMVFDATFEQHCSGAAAALFGRVRYQDETTPGVTLPHGSISVPTSGNFLYVNNGLGYERLFSPADSTFGPWEKLFEGGDYFRAFVVQGNYAHWSSVDIASPPGQPLAVGQYLRAARAAFRPAGTPGLDVGVDGGGCNELVGKFDVDEIAFAPTGELLVFQATFEQRCTLSINVTSGRIRIENPYVPQVTLPPGHLTVPATGSFLYLNGQPNDWVGLGTEQLYTAADSTFTVSLAQTGDYFAASLVQGNYAHWWGVDIAAPAGQPLATRHYVRAYRAPFRPAGSPGMDIHGDGRGCNTILGRFDVNELTFWANGDVKTFQVTFEQHCEGSLPALFGRLRYEAPPPLTLGVSLREEGLVTNKTIMATIGGTVSCSRNVPVDVSGTLRQTQAKGVVVTGSFAVHVDCVAPSTTWSAAVPPDSGSFKAGDATGSVTATACDTRCTTASTARLMKLNLGKS